MEERISKEEKMMEKKLHERRSVKVCPKCGVEFTAERPRRVVYCNGVDYQSTWNPFNAVRKIETGEYLSVSCSICQYNWRERCADETSHR